MTEHSIPSPTSFGYAVQRPIQSAITFDANIYRRLCRGASPAEAIARARTLVRAEREAGIIAVGAQGVVVELMKHLANPTDPAFTNCLAALCLLAIHCNQSIDGEGHLHLLHMSDDMLTKTLFGARTPEAIEFAEAVNVIALNVLADPTSGTLTRLHEHLRAVAVFVENVERSYVKLLCRFAERLRARPIGDRAAEKALLSSYFGRDEAATYMIQRSRAAFGLDTSEPRSGEQVDVVLEKFAVAVEFAIQRFGGVIDGARPELDANSAWDWELSFLVGRVLPPFEGARPELPLALRVLTGDKAIHRAASACGRASLVGTLDEHRAVIERHA